MKYWDTSNNRLINEKCLINKVSIRLLGLVFNSNNIIKSKTIRNIVKKILPGFKKSRLILPIMKSMKTYSFSW